MNFNKRFQMLDFLIAPPKIEAKVNPKRVFDVNNLQIKNSVAIYLNTCEFRYYDNFSLDFARDMALHADVPLKIIFLKEKFEVSKKQDFFDENFNSMLDDYIQAGFDILVAQSSDEVLEFINNKKIAFLIKDFNPIKNNFLPLDKFKIFEVDSRCIVPSHLSNHQEFSAFTYRKQIYLNIFEFLTEFPNPATKMPDEFKYFIENNLKFYAQKKNDYKADCTSNISKYLNWGFVSPLRVALEILKTDASRENIETYLEELIVRRELAYNFCLFCKNYKTFDCAYDWAKETLRVHSSDIRVYNYDLFHFENALTHDALWNEAQKDLVQNGKMHGYIRMYWAKKILEWTLTPEIALETAIYLNDKYAYDAPSASSYVGILWSIAGVHDRAFRDFPITGKIRRMSEFAIKRKQRE